MYITKLSQGVVFAAEGERGAIVLRPGFGQAFETGQVLQDLRRLQLIPPLVDTRTGSMETRCRFISESILPTDV